MDDIVIKKSSSACKRLAKHAKPFETFESALNRILDVFESPLTNNKRSKVYKRYKVTLGNIEELYPLAKDVYAGKLTTMEVTRQLEGKMHSRTVIPYVGSFISMMNGERYTRCLNTKATRYFLEQILIDFKKEGLQKALTSLNLHIDYCQGFPAIAKMVGIKQLRDEFTAKLGEL